MRAARSCEGQASVEMLALLPLGLAIVAVVFCVLAAGKAREAASAAAEAAAVALIQGGDPAAAANRAARSAHPKLTIDGARVAVAVRPHLPIHTLAALLTAHATAYAGHHLTTHVQPPRRGGDGTGATPSATARQSRRLVRAAASDLEPVDGGGRR